MNANPEKPVLISGNWKMNENHFEALRLVQELAALLHLPNGEKVLPDSVTVSVHPPFTSIRTVQTAIESDHVPVFLGAQNCHYIDKGAYTGEVSPDMLAKLGVQYVITGHSERREYFLETDEIVRKKTDAILRHGMHPILCVGETLEERNAGEAHKKVRTQLQAIFSGRSTEEALRVVVAYEPIWAIGTGMTATASDAEDMCAYIREEIGQLVGPEAADGIPIQYGGSANEQNSAELLSQKNINGLLVGGASLDAKKFVTICCSIR
jgi:triosephosphate isomerase